MKRFIKNWCCILASMMAIVLFAVAMVAPLALCMMISVWCLLLYIVSPVLVLVGSKLLFFCRYNIDL
ncbi:MAG: hypothetical protein RR413_12420 [Christensenellaceae bacterium]